MGFEEEFFCEVFVMFFDRFWLFVEWVSGWIHWFSFAGFRWCLGWWFGWVGGWVWVGLSQRCVIGLFSVLVGCCCCCCCSTFQEGFCGLWRLRLMMVWLWVVFFRLSRAFRRIPRWEFFGETSGKSSWRGKVYRRLVLGGWCQGGRSFLVGQK